MYFRKGEYKDYPYPLNLWIAVFEREMFMDELPEDWEESLEYIQNMYLKEKEKQLLRYVFQDNLSLEEVAAKLDFGPKRAWQLKDEVIKKLRSPFRRDVLLFGIEKTKGSNLDPALDRLRLDPGPYNRLRRYGIETVGQLAKLTQEDILSIRGFGVSALEKIKQELMEVGYVLAEKRHEENCEYKKSFREKRKDAKKKLSMGGKRKGEMPKYQIAYGRNGSYRVLVEAPSQKVAEGFFQVKYPDQIICEIRKIDTEDEVPAWVPVRTVPIGRWKAEGMGDCSCSVCGEVVSEKLAYCPGCHAFMGHQEN